MCFLDCSSWQYFSIDRSHLLGDQPCGGDLHKRLVGSTFKLATEHSRAVFLSTWIVAMSPVADGNFIAKCGVRLFLLDG